MCKVQNDILKFAVSRNDLVPYVEIKDMFTLRPAPSTEFQEVLAAVVKLTGDPIFAIFCQDA